MNPSEPNNPMQQVALIVVDVQDTFLKLIPEAEAFKKRVLFTIEAAKLIGMRTYLTEQLPEKLGSTHSEVLSAIGENTHPITKSSFSALALPELVKEFETLGIEHVLLAGLEIPICIYQTALSALQYDFDVTLVSDALAARRPQDAPPIIQALTAAGCNYLPSEAIFYSTLGDANHPNFRSFTQLVKKYG